MAERLGTARQLGRRYGRRQKPLRSLWNRRRICLHDGPRSARNGVPGIRSPRAGPRAQVNSMSTQTADLIAYNGKIAIQNEQRSIVEAVAVLDGKFLAVGPDR